MSIRKLERSVAYPTTVENDESESLTPGLRRWMPELYNEVGHYRERSVRIPWTAIIVAGLCIAIAAKVIS